MADLTEIQSSGSTKIAGASTTGVEDNYLDVNTDGSVDIVLQDQAGNHITSTTVTGKQALDVNVVMDVPVANSFRNITGNQTVVVKSGGGVLAGILIGNNNTNGQINLYDNTAASGTSIAVIILASPTGGLLSVTGIQPPIYLGTISAAFTTGLTVVTSGSTSNNITIIYK